MRKSRRKIGGAMSLTRRAGNANLVLSKNVSGGIKPLPKAEKAISEAVFCCPKTKEAIK
jgi:hypothetical protein